jgi:lipopolysaccharide transport protein LptA
MQKKRGYKTVILIALMMALNCANASFPTSSFHISADHSEWKQSNGEMLLVGHVFLDQSNTTLRADRLIVNMDKNHKIDAAHATGKPAIFNYNPQDSARAISAKAQTIIYHPKNQTVELIGQAQASQNHNTISGGHILYDITNGHLISDAGDSGRTTITLEQNEFNFSKKKQTPA